MKNKEKNSKSPKIFEEKMLKKEKKKKEKDKKRVKNELSSYFNFYLS